MSQLRITPVDDQSRVKTIDYMGVKITVAYNPNANSVWVKQLELMREAGIDGDAWIAMPEDQKEKWVGRAMIGTMVLNVEDMEIKADDGSVIKFSFNAPSSLAFYETQGEELLGNDKYLRDHVNTYCSNLQRFKTSHEAKVVGNSSMPLDSTTQPTVAL